MTINPQSEPASSRQVSAEERLVLVLKKQQDAAKSEAQALLSLIRTPEPGETGSGFSAYA